MEYRIDEFLDVGDELVPSVYADEIEKKINLLYDFEILVRSRESRRLIPDARESAVRNLLLRYNSCILMDNAIHGILTGHYTLNDWLGGMHNA